MLLTSHSPEVVKKLKFDNLILLTNGSKDGVQRIREGDLPYPSLNEVNFAAFSEATFEYHKELYGYLEAEGQLPVFRQGKRLVSYIKQCRDGSTRQEQVAMSQYIRNQIHHPENTLNQLFSTQDLEASISTMRTFISNGFS